MPGPRTYADSCGIARALDVVGERWAPLIIRELLHGPRRFTDLRQALPGLSADVLTQRLRELEESGVLTRRTLPAPAAARVYELTARGAELAPVLLALGRWGSRLPIAPEAHSLTPDALVVALETMFNPSAADGLRRTYELRLGDEVFAVRVDGRQLAVTRAPAQAPDLVLESDPGTLTAVLFHGRDPGQGVRATGARQELTRFLSLFEKPTSS
jgi:DNA-binding HxlR family transcriptional regulator